MTENQIASELYMIRDSIADSMARQMLTDLAEKIEPQKPLTISERLYRIANAPSLTMEGRQYLREIAVSLEEHEEMVKALNEKMDDVFVDRITSYQGHTVFIDTEKEGWGR